MGGRRGEELNVLRGEELPHVGGGHVLGLGGVGVAGVGVGLGGVWVASGAGDEGVGGQGGDGLAVVRATGEAGEGGGGGELVHHLLLVVVNVVQRGLGRRGRVRGVVTIRGELDGVSPLSSLGRGRTPSPSLLLLLLQVTLPHHPSGVGIAAVHLQRVERRVLPVALAASVLLAPVDVHVSLVFPEVVARRADFGAPVASVGTLLW